MNERTVSHITPDRTSRRVFLQRGKSLLMLGAAVPLVTGCRIIAARADDRYTITMTDEHAFEPATLTVPVGSTIVWKNMGDRRHAVTTDPDAAENAPVMVPERVVPFRSPDLFTGETWRLRLTEPGSYVYACPYHASQNMIGQITVEE